MHKKYLVYTLPPIVYSEINFSKIKFSCPTRVFLLSYIC